MVNLPFGEDEMIWKFPIPERQKMMTVEETVEESHKRVEERRKRREEAAKEAEKKIILEKEQLLIQFRREYEEQNAGFIFSCKRYGDFLTLRIVRNGNKDKKQKLFVTTINLGLVTEIKVQEGYAPHSNGKVHYYEYQMYPSRKNINYDLPICPENRTIWFDGIMNINSHYYGSSGIETYKYYAEHYTPDFPEPAHDDYVQFHGIKKTLAVPTGTGLYTLRVILDEIKQEYSSNFDLKVIE